MKPWHRYFFHRDSPGAFYPSFLLHKFAPFNSEEDLEKAKKGRFLNVPCLRGVNNR
jgi:hypothetical protein